MRIALISDIHANLPALDAVFADIPARTDIAFTYDLGDLVGYAPWPNETVARPREAGIAGISGNYDSTVATDYKHCGCKYEDPEQEKLSHISYTWTRENVSPETKSFILRASVPYGSRAARRPSLRAARDPGSRHADAQHGLLDGGTLTPLRPHPRRPSGRERIIPIILVGIKMGA